MKTIKILALGVATVLLATFIISCDQKTKEPATVEELGQMNRDFAKALVAKDAIAAANLYDENASLLPPNEPIVTGRANIQKYWQTAIDSGLISASVKTIAASSDGDLGYEIGTFELKFQGKDGVIITDIGKFTEVLKRNSEGKWMSIYGMWSANEPAK